MSRILEYRPEIDGLRAVAVIGVVVFHLNPQWLPGGFLGVDVFFVLSGYLITAIICRQIDTGTFSLKRFWLRRFFRLYPALIVMVAGVVIVGSLVQVDPERSALLWQAIAALLSFENILLWKTTKGYWAGPSENIALLHVWTLSLEEQFYLFLPVFLLVIRKLKLARVVSIAVVLIISLGLCIYATEHHRGIAFFMLPTRMWELMIGSLLAVYFPKGITLSTNASVAYAGQTIGLGMIVGSLFFLDEGLGFPGFIPLVPCLGTALVLAFGKQKSLVRSMLSLPPVIYVGKISYSLYLWHWPVIVFSRYLSVHENLVWVLVAMLSLAILSYHFVESTLRHRSTLTTGLALGITTVLVAAFSPLVFLRESPLLAKLGDISSIESISRGYQYEAGDALKTKATVEFGAAVSGDPDICVIGSSHARVLCGGIAEYAQRRGVSGLSLATSGSGITTTEAVPEVPDAVTLNKLRFDEFNKISPKLSIVAGWWSAEMEQTDFESVFQAKIQNISKRSDQVVIVGQVPMIQLPAEYHKAMRKYAIAQFFSLGKVRFDELVGANEANRLIKEELEGMNLSNVTFVDPYKAFIDADGKVRVIGDGKFLYSDYHHLNDSGAEVLVSDVLSEIFDQSLGLEE